MKLLRIFFVGCVLSSVLLLLSACGGGGDSASTDAPTGKSLYELRMEIVDVKQAMMQLLRDNELDEDPRILAADEAFMKANREFNQARREHPELAPLFEKADEIQSQSISEKVAGNEEAFQELMGQYRQARAALESKANELPEMQEWKSKLEEAERAASFAVADVASEVNAEGKKLAEQLKELSAALK